MSVGFVLWRTDMNLKQFSDLDLLGCIIGVEEAKKLYEGRLAPLFATVTGGNDPLQKLAVARELVKRVLCEGLERTDALMNPNAVRDYLRAHFAGQEYEGFFVLFLDNQHCLIAGEEMFRGTIDAAVVYPREVVKRALQLNAAAVIFAHNHPSGISEPSTTDRILTDKLKQALATIEVRALDHFVVGGTNVTSFAERGWM
jgi:DNA repair protein RadC